MKRTLNSVMRTILGAVALSAAMGSVGCSSMHGNSLHAPRAGVSMHAVATADDTFVVQSYSQTYSQSYSLVAADSIGLATFGRQIVLDDMRAARDRFAEAN